jgi:putative multiple sugar transport system permease protein
MSFINDVQKLLRENIREYGMFIALFIIMAIFGITTNGLFLSSRNLVNLVNQAGYIAVLAVGMTLVIVIRHIDLSVGFLAGFLGAVAAIAMVSWHSGRTFFILPGSPAGNPGLRCNACRMVGLPRRLTTGNKIYRHHHHSGRNI